MDGKNKNKPRSLSPLIKSKLVSMMKQQTSREIGRAKNARPISKVVIDATDDAVLTALPRRLGGFSGRPRKNKPTGLVYVVFEALTYWFFPLVAFLVLCFLLQLLDYILT